MAALKMIAKGIGVLLLVLILGVTGVVLSDFTYYKRMATFDREASIIQVDWFVPFETAKAGTQNALPRVSTEARTINQDALDQAIEFADQEKSVSLLVWHKGAIQLEHYGEGYGPETLTNSASMHKSVMALLYGIAIEEGIIPSVDEPAATYLPEWANDDRSKITIRNIMQMASGLGRAEFSLNPMSDTFKLIMGTDIAPLSFKYPLVDEPNTVFAYSNLNSETLGLILERASGMRYSELFESRLWSKVGSSDARIWIDSEGGKARTSGGLMLTGEDWLRLGLLHLNNGRVDGTQVVSEDWIKEIRTPSDANPNYGLQTWLGNEWSEYRDYGKGVPTKIRHSAPYLADDVVYFDGSGGQRVYIIPSEELVIVRTGPGGMDPETGFFSWDDAVLPNMILSGIIREEEGAETIPDEVPLEE